MLLYTMSHGKSNTGLNVIFVYFKEILLNSYPIKLGIYRSPQIMTGIGNFFSETKLGLNKSLPWAKYSVV